MFALDISADEIASRLSPEHLQSAVQAVRNDGFVALNKAIEKTGSNLRAMARFVDDPIDYIHKPQAYDFQK